MKATHPGTRRVWFALVRILWLTAEWPWDWLWAVFDQSVVVMSVLRGSLYAFGPFQLEPLERRLLRDGRAVSLTPKAFDLLVLLVGRAGRLVTKEDALKQIWPDTFIEEGNLAYTVSLLRKALGDDAEPHRYVETVPRRGYRFSAEVEAQDVVDEAVLQSAPEAPGASPTQRRWVYVAAALVALGLAATVASLKPDAFNAHSVPAPAPGQRVRLTMAGGFVNMPAISRDGTMVAYTAAAPGETNFDIWVQQIAGGGAFRLTTDPRDDLDPAFSPDGATIAFERPYTAANAAPESGSPDLLGIFLVPTLGGQPRLLVADGGVRPTFSPDGNWLAYTRSTGVAVAEMFMVPVRGGAPRRLAKDLTWVDGSVWSPDGAHVLTMGHRERWPPFHNDWFLVPVDGGPAVGTDVATVLDHTPEPSTLASTNSTRVFPKPQAWHADGDRIVYYALDGDTKNLWLVRLDPVARRIVGAPERVTHGTDDEELVSVSASGRLVYTSYDLRVDLWSVPLAMTVFRRPVLSSSRRTIRRRLQSRFISGRSAPGLCLTPSRRAVCGGGPRSGDRRRPRDRHNFRYARSRLQPGWAAGGLCRQAARWRTHVRRRSRGRLNRAGV